MRSIETVGSDGAERQRISLRAALREAVEVVEQLHEARQARDDRVDGFVADGVAVFGVAVLEGVAEELPGAVVDKQVHALLDDGDVGEEVLAGGLA